VLSSSTEEAFFGFPAILSGLRGLLEVFQQREVVQQLLEHCLITLAPAQLDELLSDLVGIKIPRTMPVFASQKLLAITDLVS
jgi:hypothetical protein